MPSALTRKPLSQSPLQILLVITLLQLVVCLFTNGFTLSFDESMWHYIGRNWLRHGMVPYSGGIDNKSPLIFLIYGISDFLFGVNYWFPRVLGTLVQSAGIYFLYLLAAHLEGKRAGIWVMSIYGLSLMWRSTDGKYPSLTETYAITLLLIAFYKYLVSIHRKDFFFSGMIAALALGFRITAIFGITAVCISGLRKNRVGQIIFCTGILTGICVLILLAIAAGIDPAEYLKFGVTENFGTGSITERSFSWRLQSFLTGFFNPEMILFYIPLAGYFLVKKKSTLLIAWLILEFAGINFIGMYARPHFKNLLPVFSILSGLSINYFVETFTLPARHVLLIIWILFFPNITEPIYSVKNWLFPPQADPAVSCSPPFPHPDDLARKKMGRWIKENTADTTTVFIGGYGAQVQAYSERISPTRYFNLTQTPSAIKIFKDEISANNPGLLIIPLFTEYSGSPNKEIEFFLAGLAAKNYLKRTCMYGYAVYQKK